MKIFISHSSKNKLLGEKLVDLLRNIGLKENEIIFTSNIAYGIPIGQNIFNWLKSQISEKPFVIYLLTEEYYQSIACLNEMGAAWIIENKHAAIFTPDFNLSSKEFQSGALDPREIGFYINDEERILSFIHILAEYFEITKNNILISQSVKKFIKEISEIKQELIPAKAVEVTPSTSNSTQPISISETSQEVVQSRGVSQEQVKEKILSKSSTDLFKTFKDLVLAKKLKDDEMLLLHYIMDTGHSKLKTGWQENEELINIREWEKVNDINDTLSKNYPSALRRLELRKFIEVSALTASNNPKELKIRDEIGENLMDLPIEVQDILTECVKKNFFEYKDEPKDTKDDWAF
jgi:hypothetical protein